MDGHKYQVCFILHAPLRARVDNHNDQRKDSHNVDAPQRIKIATGHGAGEKCMRAGVSMQPAARVVHRRLVRAYNVAESGLCFRIEGEKNHGTSLHAFMKSSLLQQPTKNSNYQPFYQLQTLQRLCIIAAKESAIHKDNEARGFFLRFEIPRQRCTRRVPRELLSLCI
jgi:hypothetical protein